MTILSSPAALTASIMTDILREKGVISHAVVTGLRWEPIGEGLIGDTVRFHLAYDREEPGAPDTIAGKFPAADPGARASGARLGLYMNEVRFYQEIAPFLSVSAPRCFHAEVDAQGEAFALLMEDAAPARAADQIIGCTLSEAKHVIRQAAALHAPTFGDARYWDVDCMKLRERSNAAVMPMLSDYAARFRSRYAGMIAEEELDLVDRFAQAAAALVLQRPARFSLIHADLRLDNMLFDAKGGEIAVMLLDWQCVSPGNPCYDLSYFLQTSYPMEALARDEEELIRCYRDAAAAHGLAGYGIEDIWEDYRTFSWAGLMTALIASDVAKRTPQGDRVFTRMATGSIRQMMRLRTLDQT